MSRLNVNNPVLNRDPDGNIIPLTAIAAAYLTMNASWMVPAAITAVAATGAAIASWQWGAGVGQSVEGDYTSANKSFDASMTTTAATGMGVSGVVQFGNALESTQKTDKTSATWGNQNTLKSHFDKHGVDFGAKNAESYASRANQFYQNKDKYETKIGADGVVRVYDQKTNTFGSYNPDGSTKTFYKPSSPTYFERQPTIKKDKVE